MRGENTNTRLPIWPFCIRENHLRTHGKYDPEGIPDASVSGETVGRKGKCVLSGRRSAGTPRFRVASHSRERSIHARLLFARKASVRARKTDEFEPSIVYAPPRPQTSEKLREKDDGSSLLSRSDIFHLAYIDSLTFARRTMSFIRHTHARVPAIISIFISFLAPI